jgi:hypothetical protein
MKSPQFSGKTALFTVSFVTTVVFTILALVVSNGIATAQDEFTTDFRIEDCTFSNRGRNPYFSLNPGDRLTLTDGEVVLEIRVLDETKTITFETAKGKKFTVKTRVVQELETENGHVIERSRNFFARCVQTNDIHYFGETVEPAAIGGAWLAGADGALPGVIMPGTFLLGSRYFQEIAPGVALDRAEHLEMGLTVETEAGTFHDCVRIIETTPLEAGESEKVYCPGIGLVMDGDLELIEFKTKKNGKHDDD